MTRKTLAVLALLAACLPAPAHAQWVWSGDAGWTDMAEAPASSDHGAYAHASGLFVRGDYAAAMDAYAEMIRKHPASPQIPAARFGIARCQAKLGQPAKAAALCAELLRQPGELDRETLVNFHLDMLRRLAGAAPAAAAAQLESVAAEAPTATLRYDAHMERARALMRLDRLAEAREAAMSAADAAPETAIGLRNEALLFAGVADFTANRVHGHDAQRMERAQAALRRVAASGQINETTKRAREYLDLADRIMAAGDAAQRDVYYAASHLYEGRCDAAYPILKRAASQFAGVAAGESALFYQAECLYRQGRDWAAFLVLEKLLREYPATQRLRAIVEREFDIGSRLTESSRSRAMTVMNQVTLNNPGGPLADDALMATGRMHMEREQFAQAREAFEQVAQGYPRSEWNSAALFQSGKADLRESTRASDNEMLLGRAERAFEVYLRNEPDGPFAGEARTLLASGREQQAQGLLQTARFYRRRGEARAAAVYCSTLLKEHPRSTAAEAARAMLEQLAAQGVTP